MIGLFSLKICNVKITSTVVKESEVDIKSVQDMFLRQFKQWHLRGKKQYELIYRFLFGRLTASRSQSICRHYHTDSVSCFVPPGEEWGWERHRTGSRSRRPAFDITKKTTSFPGDDLISISLYISTWKLILRNTLSYEAGFWYGFGVAHCWIAQGLTNCRIWVIACLVTRLLFR